MAQTASTGALTGTVTDSSGAVIPNVTVTAVSSASGATRTATTGSDGSFNMGLLPLGLYTVKFEAVGFNTAEVGPIEVKVTETATLNRVLQVGTQTQQVVVQGEAVEAVQTANATLGDVVGGASATALPLTTRNYTNLLGLSSGASAGVFNATTLGKGSTDINVNGATTAQNTLQMDGVAIMTSSSTGTLTENGNNPGMGYVSPDAMEEFKIQTSLFDAGYGRGPGASVNLVTKSGTNEWHGTAFEFFRNTALNANDFFRNSSLPVNGAPNNSRQVLNQNQFGGVLGGPIKKDKLFVFGSYQGTRQINGAAAQGYSTPQLLPIPDGNNRTVSTFASDLGAVFCPTGADGGQSSTVPVQVNCNGSNINPIAIALLQAKNPDGTYLIPSASGTISGKPCTAPGVLPAVPTCTSVTQATTFTNPARFTENQVLGNLDYLVNEKNTLALRFFYTTDPTTIPFGCGSGGGLPGICYPDTGLASTLGNIYGVLKLTTIVSNHVVNEARLSIQRATIVGQVTNPFTASQFGITPIQAAVPYLPQVTVAGVFTVGDASNYPVSKFVTNWEAADQVSWTHDKHTIRFGVELERDRYDWHLIGGSATGQINFTKFQDFLLALPGCPPGETASVCTASEALNSPNGTNGTSNSNIANTGTISGILPPGGLIHGYRTPYGNAFIQDDFKVNQRLTLNLGLRWEYISAAYDSGGFMTNIWSSLINNVPIPGNSLSCPNASLPAGTVCTPGTLAGWVVPANFNPSANAVPPVGGVFQNTSKTFRMGNTPLDAFAPRLGFAFSPFASNRFVIRGGAGYFYDKTGNANYNSGYEQNEPYSISAFGSGSGIVNSTFACPFFSPSPTSSCAVPSLGWTPRWVNFGTPGTNAGFTSSNLSIASTQQNYGTPVTYQWNLNAQYEFIHSWTLELGYVGSRALRQPGIATSRNINEAQLIGNPANANQQGNTAAAPAITAGLVTGANTTANAVLRVPYLGFAASGLAMTDDEAAFKYNSIQATVRKQFTHNFQLQGAYTYARSFVTQPSFNDPNVQFYSLNPQYHPQRLAVSYLWILPLGTHEGLLGKLTSGWGWSGVTILQDGTPLTAADNRGGAIYGLNGASNIISTAEYCPGTNASMAASPGSTESRLGGRYSANGWFNPTTFNSTAACSIPNVLNANGTATNGTGWGNSSLGILLGPGQFNWDMSLTKTTTVGGIREGATLTFRTEFFNTFNHPQFNNPPVASGIAGAENVNSSTFGNITSTSVNPRLIQFALRYAF